jgi:hypothetical protein
MNQTEGLRSVDNPHLYSNFLILFEENATIVGGIDIRNVLTNICNNSLKKVGDCKSNCSRNPEIVEPPKKVTRISYSIV